jgi:ABC-type polar amino acid transport system ATPase subunit
MLEIKNLKKLYGDLEVLKGINQVINDKEVLCIIGPSGGGKSTLLRCLNHLEEPTEGEIYIDGELITEENLTNVRERMGMVFQSFNLFPHMTVLENVTVGPIHVKGKSQEEAEKHAKELLEKRAGANIENCIDRKCKSRQKLRR